MSKRVRRRRGTQPQHDTFVGADGELTVNTTDYRIHAHDGATAGGFSSAREDEVLHQDQNLSDVDSASSARSNLGLGSAATKSADQDLATTDDVDFNSVSDNGNRVYSASNDSVTNVKEAHGAAGDGSTDDAAALQNAIDAAGNGTSPAVVFLPEGTYITSTTLSVPSNVTIRGVGTSLSVVKLHNSADVDVFTNSDQTNGNSDIAFESFKIDGNRGNQTDGAKIQGIIFDAPDGSRNQRLTLTDIWITSTEGTGFHPKGTDFLTMQNVLIENGGIGGNTLYHNLYLRRNDHVDLRGVKCRGPIAGRNAKIGPSIKYGYIQIESEDASLVGVSISGDTHSLEVHVIDQNSGDDGVLITTEDSNSPESCSFYLNVRGATVHGVHLRASNNFVQATASNCADEGVRVGAADQNVITVHSRNNDKGILFESTADNNTLTGSVIRGNTTANIQDNGTGNVIANNVS